MKNINTRWGLIALVPLVAIVILSIGNRIGVVPDQTQVVRAAETTRGLVVAGGITQGQVLRFNVAHLANVAPGPPSILELKVFDSQGNVVATHQFQFPNPGPNQNGGGGTGRSSFFDLNGNNLPPGVFDNTGRAQLTGILTHQSGGIGGGGCVFSGEIFSFGDGNGKTLVYIGGTFAIGPKHEDP